MDKALKNSTQGRVAYIWRIERFQIDGIKFERTQINFFSGIFTAVVVVIAQAPYCVHLRTSSSKTQMLLLQKNLFHKYCLFCYRFVAFTSDLCGLFVFCLSLVNKSWNELKQCNYPVVQSALMTGFWTDFTAPVWTFYRWVANVPPGETSPAARSKEKRLFSQAINVPVSLLRHNSSSWKERCLHWAHKTLSVGLVTGISSDKVIQNMNCCRLRNTSYHVVVIFIATQVRFLTLEQTLAAFKIRPAYLNHHSIFSNR